MRHAVTARTVLVGVAIAVAGLMLEATSMSRRWPSVSRQSRAGDTPVLAHVEGAGPYGGSVTSLAVARTNPHTTFVALRGGGVYRTVDRGRRWQPADRGLPPDQDCELTTDPIQGDTLYAVCGNGLFKTVDGGRRWRQLDVDNPWQPVIARADPRILYDGSLRSRDGGAHWAEVAPLLAFPLCVDGSVVVDISTPTRLFCISDDTLIESRDGGARWIPVASPAGVGLSVLAAGTGEPDRLLASAADGAVYAVSTRGAAWTRLGALPDGQDAGAMAINDAGDIVVASQAERLVRSVDGGRTWQVLPAAWPSSSLQTFAVDSSAPDILYAGTSVGPYVSEDGGRTWQLRTRGLTRAPSTVVVHEGVRPAVFVSVGGEVVWSDDNGDTWSPVHELFSERIDAGSLAPDGAGGVLLRAGSRALRLPADTTAWVDDIIPSIAATSARTSGRWGGLRLVESATEFHYSSDGGTSWHHATFPSGVMPSDVISLDDDSRRLLAVVGGLGTLMAGGQSSLWHSRDAGGTWAPTSDVEGPPLAWCCAMSRSSNDPNLSYLTRSGMIIGGGGVELLRTTDRGRTWTAGTIFASEVAIVPTRPETLLAHSYDRGVVRSTDGGLTWTSSGSGLPTEATVTGFAFGRQYPTTVFAATSNRGVYRSHDAGLSWTPTGHDRQR